MFEIWDQSKAYLLGFIAADGCNEGRSISIQILNNDLYILEKFKDIFKEYGINCTLKKDSRYFICKNGSIHTYSRLRVYGKSIITEFNNLGIVKRKSRILDMPIIPIEYRKDFFRGYFDGNGHIFSRRKHLEIEIYSASINFITGVKSWLEQDLKLKSKAIGKKINIFRLKLYSNEAKLFCSIIYSSNPVLYLVRKKTIYDNFKSIPNPIFWTSEQERFIINNYKSLPLEELVSNTKKSYSAVRKKIWSLKKRYIIH